MEGGESRVGAALTNVALLAAYLTLNSTLNLLNKWSLGIYGFAFPLFMTVSHMVFSFIILAPVMMFEPFRKLHVATVQKQWKGLLCIGACMAINIALNNLSLVEITLSLNQVIRSAIPVVTAVLAIAIEKKVPTRFEGVGLLVLVSGVMLAVWEGAAGSPRGIVLCIAGTVSNAAMMTMSGKILSERLDVLRLTFYTAPVSCLCLLPFFKYKEAARLAEYAAEHTDGVYQGLLLLGCANALAYNVIHYLMIQRTSAVTTTVLGEIKIVGLLLLSSLLLGESSQMTLRMIAGCALAILGFCLYSHAKLAAFSAKNPATSTPAKTASADIEAASEKASLLPNLADGESKMSRTSSIRQLTGTIKAVRFDRGH